jgi:hypothetical protein
MKRGVLRSFIREGNNMNTDHSDEKPTHALYWEALAVSAPQEVCRRTEALFDPDRQGYVLPVLGRRNMILPRERKILILRGGGFEEEIFRDNYYLMVLLYLLNAREGEPDRTWISEKELKGGTTFFRGPHALPVEEIRRAFGRDPEGFMKAGLRLGGVEVGFGDRAFALTVFPKVPLAYVLWQEDREFPARVTVLFDATIQRHFPLDGIWCLVAEAGRLLLETEGR